MQMVTDDRISELPDFILHVIMSNLDTKEACRASVLSKKWYGAWSSIPVLDFRVRYFKKYKNVSLKLDDAYYDDVTVQRYLGFIDKTLQRYYMQKYRITKLHLEIPEIDGNLKLLVDQWIEIAVQNHVQELDVDIFLVDELDYALPAILFCAKSLKVLKCKNLELPYYDIMELTSLECLTLVFVTTDGVMLQRIISLCSLVKLHIEHAYIEKITLPWTGQVNEVPKCFGSGTMRSNLKVSPLTNFVFEELEFNLPWPWTMNMGALKNLRKLEISCPTITDDIVSELAQGLVALECLVLAECSMLKYIMISSISLKEFRIVDMFGLMKTTIDAPNLLELWYNSEVKGSLSLIRAHDHCNAQFFPLVESQTISAGWFINLNKFFVETNCFKSLVVDVSFPHKICEEVDLLWNVVTVPPYKLRELKLLKTGEWFVVQSSLVAFLDGLFWSCHPDVLSIPANLANQIAKEILNILKRKVKCWKHPLQSIEVEAVDYSSLLSKSSELEMRFRLSWL